MANRLLTEMRLSPNVLRETDKFPNLEGIKPSTRARAPADWDYDTRFGKVPIWSNAHYDNNQILNNGASWLQEIQNNTISIRTVIKGLRLALSLQSMSRAGERLLIQHPRPSQQDENNLAMALIPNLEEFSDRNFALRNPQVIAAPEEGDYVADAVVPDPLIQNVYPNANQNQNQRRFAYCFLASYLMKMLVKSADNAVHGVTNMKRRFYNFYGPSTIVSQFALTPMQAQTYKDALISQPRILTTYALLQFFILKLFIFYAKVVFG